MAKKKVANEREVVPEIPQTLDPSLFKVVGKNTERMDSISRPSLTFWQDAWRRFRKNRAAFLGLRVIALYVILAVFRRIWLAGVAPYWYLLVLAEAVLLLAFMMRFNAYRLGLVFCVLGLVLRFVYSMQPSGGIGAVICKVFYTVFSWNCNVVMTGFPLMFLGYTFSRNGKLLRHMRRTVIGILYLISVLAAFLVYGFSYSHYGIPFWLIESVLLFLFCILPAEYEARLPAPLCRAARNLSSVIYLTHTALLSLFGYVFHIWDTAIRFVLCVAVSILLTYFIKKLNWSPLSKLMMVK